MLFRGQDTRLDFRAMIFLGPIEKRKMRTARVYADLPLV
jgi:hypothetical protein